MSNKFSWTEEYRRTWEEEEDKDISIVKHRNIIPNLNLNRKNIIRHLLMIIDTSESIEKNDYLPSIRYKISKSLPKFAKKFSRINPLSTLSFMTVSNLFEQSSKDCELNFLSKIGQNKFSLLNCLKSIEKSFKNCKYPKECIIITGSIGSFDDDSIIKTLEKIQKAKIKINIISLCGEVTLFKNVCKTTNGKMIVPSTSNPLESILNSFIYPSDSFEQKCALLEVGFPKTYLHPHLCICHFDFKTELFECPQCKALVCSIPTQCPVCSLPLISPFNIFKSGILSFPLQNYIESFNQFCKVCSNDGIAKCSKCDSVLCKTCYQKLCNYLMFCPYCI